MRQNRVVFDSRSIVRRSAACKTHPHIYRNNKIFNRTCAEDVIESASSSMTILIGGHAVRPSERVFDSELFVHQPGMGAGLGMVGFGAFNHKAFFKNSVKFAAIARIIAYTAKRANTFTLSRMIAMPRSSLAFSSRTRVRNSDLNSFRQAATHFCAMA